MWDRVVVWFSCGAASAVAAKLAVIKYGKNRTRIVYCDTGSEHPDNKRFLIDVGKWIGMPITILKSREYKDIWEVFEKTRYLVGVAGARCTTELKKKLRLEYQNLEDIQVFGYTSEEKKRATRFENNNPELNMEWILIDKQVSKKDCLAVIARAGIEIPRAYKLGFKNNNCLMCVKGQQGFFNLGRRIGEGKVPQATPEEVILYRNAFNRMAKVERKLNVAINKTYAGDGKRKRVFLDELDPNAGNYEAEQDISCGLSCGEISEEIEECES